MKLIAYRSSSFKGSAEEEAGRLGSILPWVDSMHLRGPESESEEYLRRLVELLPQKEYPKLWLHDHFELAVEFGLGGIHLSRKALLHDRALGIYAGIHGLGASISCHDQKNAARFDELYDRVFVCPVFESNSKPGHRGSFNMDELSGFLKGHREAEFIALGGVGIEKLGTVKDLGFDGAAVLGALWDAGDPAGYIKRMREECGKEQNTY